MNTPSEKHTCDELGICMGRRCLGCQYNRYPFAPGVIEREDATHTRFSQNSENNGYSPSPLAWRLLLVFAVLTLLALVFDLPARLLLP